MRIKNIFKRKPSKYDQLVDDIQASFNNVASDTEYLSGVYAELRYEFNALSDEIGNNGVVRDLRNLEKENKILKDALAGLNGYVDEVETNLEELKQHTASLIMQHDEQINQTSIKKKSNDWVTVASMLCGERLESPVEPTLAGKVEAIIEHLNLDVSATPKKVTKAKVEAKKKKPVKKNKR